MILQVSKHNDLYSAKFWWGKTLANRSFMSFGEEIVCEFTIANISFFSEPGIWLGKILVNGVRFVKFVKIFSYQNFVLYGSYLQAEMKLSFEKDDKMASFLK